MRFNSRAARPVRIVLAASMASAVWLHGAPAGADTETQRQSLAGVGGVHLHLALVGDDLAPNRLTEDVLHPEIEARLVASGLRSLTPEGSAKEPGVPWLFASLAVQKSQEGKIYAWSVRIDLEQRACLERDPKICGSVTTWSSSRFGSAGRRRVKTLRQDLLDAVDEFIAAYLAANPRH